MKSYLLLTCLAAAAVSAVDVAAQDAPGGQPVFRTGVELLPIEVIAVDERGHQVTDLSPDELTVSIDGTRRVVRSADYIAAARADATAADGEAYYSTNEGGRAEGRAILLVVDQSNISAANTRAVVEQARLLVGGLRPGDRIAAALIPTPGSLFDFTTDHARVQQTVARALGLAEPASGRFSLTPAEAVALHFGGNAQLAAEVMFRKCASAPQPRESDPCQQEVLHDAAQLAVLLEEKGQTAMHGLESVMSGLAAAPGQKRMVLLTEGGTLLAMGPRLEALAARAIDQRIRLDILRLDASTANGAASFRPALALEADAARADVLDRTAARTGGAVQRVTPRSALAFERVLRGFQGFYVVAVEGTAEDHTGKGRSLAVSTSRAGVTVRAPELLPRHAARLAGTSAAVLARAMAAPDPIRDLPMRLSTWQAKDTETGLYRLVVGVEVGWQADEPLEHLTAVALVDRQNRAVMPDVKTERLSPATSPGRAAYTTTFVVEPGWYRVHAAMADARGRLGSVGRKVEVFFHDAAAIEVGDLMLAAQLAPNGPTATPAIEPHTSGQPLAAAIDVYVPPASEGALAAHLEIAHDATSPALVTIPMQLADMQRAGVATLQARIRTATLPPGRYLARARVTQAKSLIGRVLRPFTVEQPTRSANEVAHSSQPGPLAAVTDALPAFDTAELYAPAIVKQVLVDAADQQLAADAALPSALSADFAAAARIALAAGDQRLAAFLQGLALLRNGETRPAATQFRVALTQAPRSSAIAAFLGASLAADGRHREAAALLQQGADAPRSPDLLARLAGEAWLRAGSADNAIAVLESRSERRSDLRLQKALGLAYVLANRPADALPPLVAYLARHPDDRHVLLAAIYAAYARHAAQPGPTLSEDTERARSWLEAYHALGGEQPLAGVWVTYLEAFN